MKRNKACRTVAAALIAALLLPQAAIAAAPTTQTDETVYINLDAYGVPTNTRIVKGVSLNGLRELTDFGSYSEVYNMSSDDKPTIAEDGVTWALSDAYTKPRFYYECIPNEPDAITLPWDLDVSYKLNGVPVTAATCAGASGLIEIDVHTTPNDSASEYYRNNMTLVCGTAIDMDKTLSLEAEGAQLQSIGSYKLAMFIGLPGEENTFKIRIGSDSFESMGVFMMMTPGTLSQLDMLEDLRTARDVFDDSGDDIYNGLNDMLGTMNDMKSGLGDLSKGLSGIDDVRQQLIASRGTLDPLTDNTLDAMDALAGSSDSIIPELNASQKVLGDINLITGSMITTLNASAPDIKKYLESLDRLSASLTELQAFADDVDDTKKDITSVRKDFEDALDDLADSADSMRHDISAMQNNLDDLNDNMGDLDSSLDDVSNYSNALAGYLAELKQLEGTVGSGSGGGTTPSPSDPAVVVPTAPVPNINEVHQGIGNLQDTTASLSDTCGTLSDALDTFSDTLDSMDTLSDACYNLLDLVKTYQDIADKHDGMTTEMIDNAQQISQVAKSTLQQIDVLRGQAGVLQIVTSDGIKLLQSANEKIGILLGDLSSTLGASTALLSQLQDTLQSVRSQADKSSAQSIDGILDVLGRAIGSTASGSLQQANTALKGSIDEQKDNLEEDTNVIEMDNSLALQSCTSDENPTPSSLQFILRTEEISIDDDDDSEAIAEAEANEGMFARIGNVFKKLFSAIVGVFSSDE